MKILNKVNLVRSSLSGFINSAGKKLLNWIKDLDGVVDFLKNLTVIALFALIVPLIFKVLTKNTIMVQEVTVPAELENRGLSGRVFSQRVIDKILEIANYTEVLKEREDIYGLSKKNQRPDIDLPINIFGVNLETLLGFIKTGIGKSDVRIVGEVITEIPAKPNSDELAGYSVRFRVAKVGTIYQSTSPITDIDLLAEKAAMGVMEEYEPITMAYYYRGKQKYEDAFRMTEKAILKKRPGDIVWAHFVRGLIEMDQARWALAEEEFRFVLERNTSFPRIHNNLSIVLRRQGKFEDALKESDKAIEAEPTRAQSYLNKAWCLIEMGKNPEAEKWLEKAIATEPDNETGHLNMADYYRKNRQLDLAVKHYRMALDIKPNSPRIYSNLAGTLGDMGQWKDAEQVTQKALAFNPKDGISLGYMGYISLERKDYENARKFYDAAFASDPSYFRYYIGHARIAMHEKKYDQAEELLNAAQKANPRWWDTYKFKGDLALLRGNKKLAMDFYEQSTKLNPKAPDVLARIAWLAQSQGNSEISEKYSQKAMESAPYLYPTKDAVLKIQFLPT
ncbi:tetratricopeptide repeat protein [Polynucleobacter sp. TSB-Sco08W16]|uniref:tetratricopeptide repeat protein n=1 Tax=Polynucleobacter sp. TSB-Sco08W16 TaxID=1758374 RepID=UPI001BFECBF9|nr:tetratricopeptide repeat protein [Polynucleobacter sp. TSB-Sco08W16]QWD74738.1 tetratricopeptide repeat protein [Polynucleobacter sp. TSB-Sco08W16]